MRGVILKNAYMSFEAYDSQAERLKEEFAALGVQTDILRNNFFAVTLDGRNIKNKLAGYDFCVYLDKDKYALNGLEACGMRLFNGYRAIELCDDKMTTYLALAGKGITFPVTMPAPLCYSVAETIKEETYEEIENTLGYPLIVKCCFGSRGNGVYKINNRSELVKKCDELKCTPHLYQKFIAGSCGKDVRVIVVGGRVLGGMERISAGEDFRSNVALGGCAKKFDPDEKTHRLCERVAEILGLDYCGIDLLFGEDGFYVCEVNSNAFFFEFERTTHINVAKAYAEYIVKSVKKE